MRRAHTAKSRLAGIAATLCVIPVYIVYGWLELSLPSYVVLLFALIPTGLLHLSNTVREREGEKIPDPELLPKEINRLGQLEMSLNILNALLIVLSFAAIWIGERRDVQRIIFCASITLLFVSPIANLLLDRKYLEMVKDFQGARERT